jgi:hypothetical protein
VPEIPPNNLNTQKISPCSTKLEGALKWNVYGSMHTEVTY